MAVGPFFGGVDRICLRLNFKPDYNLLTPVPIAVWNDVPRRVYTDTAKNEEYKPKYAGRPASSEYASAEIIIF